MQREITQKKHSESKLQRVIDKYIKHKFSPFVSVKEINSEDEGHSDPVIFTIQVKPEGFAWPFAVQSTMAFQWNIEF